MIHLKILKRKIKSVANHQLAINLQLKTKLEADLSSLVDRCTKVNEARKFTQVCSW